MSSMKLFVVGDQPFRLLQTVYPSLSTKPLTLARGELVGASIRLAGQHGDRRAAGRDHVFLKIKELILPTQIRYINPYQ